MWGSTIVSIEWGIKYRLYLWPFGIIISSRWLSGLVLWVAFEAPNDLIRNDLFILFVGGLDKYTNRKHIQYESTKINKSS